MAVHFKVLSSSSVSSEPSSYQSDDLNTFCDKLRYYLKEFYWQKDISVRIIPVEAETLISIGVGVAKGVSPALRLGGSVLALPFVTRNLLVDMRCSLNRIQEGLYAHAIPYILSAAGQGFQLFDFGNEIAHNIYKLSNGDQSQDEPEPLYGFGLGLGLIAAGCITHIGVNYWDKYVKGYPLNEEKRRDMKFDAAFAGGSAIPVVEFLEPGKLEELIGKATSPGVGEAASIVLNIGSAISIAIGSFGPVYYYFKQDQESTIYTQPSGFPPHHRTSPKGDTPSASPQSSTDGKPSPPPSDDEEVKPGPRGHHNGNGHSVVTFS